MPGVVFLIQSILDFLFTNFDGIFKPSEKYCYFEFNF